MQSFNQKNLRTKYIRCELERGYKNVRRGRRGKGEIWST
jgi:hypothetical protein